MNENRVAFRDMIGFSEGVMNRHTATFQPVDPYTVCYGLKYFMTTFTDHPTSLGLWKGEPLDALGEKYKGMHSTAAGKYQITVHTWVPIKASLALLDFGHSSQDAACDLLIRQCKALDLVDSGQVAAAIALCHPIWASLPGSTAGQPITPIAKLLQAYDQYGGGLA